MPNKSTNHKEQRLHKGIDAKESHKPDNYNKTWQNTMQMEEKPNYFLIPILIMLCLIPLIVKLVFYKTHLTQYVWFSAQDEMYDFFLYNKQGMFIFVAGVMAIIVIIKVISSWKTIKITPIYIPIIAYAVLALLSSIFSDYTSFSFYGGFEQFESFFVLLGYCIIVIYATMFIKSEKDFKIIVTFLIVFALIMGILGVSQYLGHDFFSTELGRNIMIPEKYRDSVDLSYASSSKLTYMTLFNPNYVGVYIALVTPIIAVMLFFQKKIGYIIVSVITVIALLISAMGSKSLAGIVGLGAALLFSIIFMRKILIKRYYITIPVIVILIIGIFIENLKTDNMFTDKLYNALHGQKTEYALTDMHTEEDSIALTYNNNEIKIKYVYNAGQDVPFLVTDANDQMMNVNYDSAMNEFFIPDERFAGIKFGTDQETAGIFHLLVDGRLYRFTNQTGDGKYYFVNRYGKFDRMITAKSAVFTDFGSFASSRGYIWSRTIPLIKKYIFLGSGPDTFILAYPQQDYMNMTRYGFGDELMTKPHSLYLQIAIQTGLLSLIAFLVFYVMYFVSSIRLYIRGCFNSYYAKVGIAILIGTISYMVAGLTNDSSICTAPVFWVLIGVGIAANYKAKPLIMKEVNEMKEKKLSQKIEQ